MTFTVDDFLGEFEPPTVDVQVCPRTDLVEQHRSLDRQLAEEVAKSAGALSGGRSQRMAEEVRDLEAQIEEATRTFRFRALSRRRWLSLLAAHPPRKQDREDQADFNIDTFPVAAIAACAVEPTMTEEQAAKVADALPLGEFEKMWRAVLKVNVGVNDTPKSVLATATLRTNGASLTTAAPEESPAASS